MLMSSPGLSLENEIESRLVVGEDWKVEHGPFDETRFQQLGNRIGRC